MKTPKKRVISFLLVVLMLLSMLLPELISADIIVIGGAGSIPGGGTSGAGGGIINLDNPTFVVSFTKEIYSGESALSSNPTYDELVAKTKLQFKNHVPSSDYSIFFAPPGSYDDYVNKSTIAWANLSTGSLNYIVGGGDADPTHKNKLRRMGAGSNSSIWHNELLAAIPAGGDRSALANYKWRDIADNADKTAQSIALWSWILAGNGKNIESRLKEFGKATLNSQTEEGQNKQACAWLDLMISLWQLSPPAAKKAYEIEIERYLKDDNTIESPPLISISTAVLIRAPKYNPQYLFIKSADYIHFIARVVPTASLYTRNARSRNNRDYASLGYKNMIKDAVNDSLNDLPGATRTTNLTGDAARNDAFNWGMSGVMTCRLSTVSGSAVIRDSTEVIGAMSALNFNGEMFGFAIAAPFGYGPKFKPNGRFSIKTNSPETVILKGTDETISEKVYVDLEIAQKGEKLTKWQNRLKGTFTDGFPKLEIILERTAPALRQADKASPAVSDTNPQFSTSSQWKGDGEARTIDKAVLLKMIENATEKITYVDNTVTYPIAENTIVEFKYKAAVKIHLSNTEAITLEANPGEDNKIFSRPEEPEPVIVSYISEPSYWSEIKNGSPGNEPFEAMAGVPTTRNLYFASGGSEFIVETEFEYVQDTETTRYYRSYFTAVDSEFKTPDTAVMAGQQHSFREIRDNWSTSWAAHSSKPAHPAANPRSYSWTAKSDGLTRTITETATWVDTSSSWTHSCPGHGGSETSPPSYDHCGDSPGTASGYWLYTVDMHKICGPQCSRILPQVEDTWCQKIKFDHMKINVARVWKLDKAAVDGMIDITGTDEFKATVISGDPNIFYNISATNKSIDGRLRYTVEPDKHDIVEWNEGPRTNKDDGVVSQTANLNPVNTKGHQNAWAKGILYNNHSEGKLVNYTNEENYHRNRGVVSTGPSTTADSVDVTYSAEWAKFNERRLTPNTATVISDMLILQTSSGDQSIMYFQKDSVPRQTQQNYPKVVATKEEMWDNNPLSFAKKNPDDINIGSYNGKFYTPLSKYSVYKSVPVATKFDTVPAGKIRPVRPAAAMRLVNLNLDIIDTNPNGYYETGESAVFYRNILNYGTGSPVYEIVSNTRFGATGAEYVSTYSDNHSKVNDIVIHNPVSTEFSFVVPLADIRDQRTADTENLGGNLQGPLVESVKRLKNPTPKQNLIWNGDAEQIDDQGKLSNWKTWESVPGKATFTKRTSGTWKISGNSTFEIITEPNNNYNAVYYTDIPGIPGDSYSFTGKLGAHRTQGYAYITALNAAGSILGRYSSAIAPPNGVVQNLTINFTAPAGTVGLRVHIVNGNTVGYVANSNEYIFADDLVLYDNTTTTWQAMSYEINEYASVPNPDYITPYEIPNPDYIPASPGTNATLNYTGNVQTFVAPATGNYELEVWGAQGGNGSGGLGGYSKGNIALTKGETLYIYVGGADGWNGGGSGHGRASDVGGGGTDIRKDGQSLSHRIIVAGGGGGNGPAAGGSGGGTTGGIGEDRCGTSGGGGTQTAGGTGGSSHGGSGSFGQGGSNSSGDRSGGGGGGGGWYGGGAGGNDYSSYNDYDDSGGGGGSGYIGGVTGGTMDSGVRSGHGQVKIVSPPAPAIGSPTIRVNNRRYIPAVVGDAVDTTFNYTGEVQTFTAPRAGSYSFDVWGAQGGSMGSGTGGKGGNAKGSTTLSQGEILNVYVGGQPHGYNAAGWNGGGSSDAASGGGGASDIRRGGTNLSNRIIAAGGGGGGGSGNGSETHDGGAGGGTTGGSGTAGTGGTQTSGGTGAYSGSLGQGANGNSHGTAGGGGYYGGGGGSGCSHSGGGGSGYIGSLTNTSMSNGVRSGHGMIKISAPGINTPAQGIPWIEGLSPTIEVLQPVTHTITSAPDSWYENVIVTIPAAQEVTIPDGGGTFTPGNFINLDYEFEIYFPNRGDFFGDNSYGISQVTDMRGKGFINDMPTKEWTKEKYAVFEFNVIHNGVGYRAGQDVPLAIEAPNDRYKFYCPLANYEAISAEVTFKVIAINGNAVDNDYPANKERYSYYDARHSGIKRFNIDVVGRIGNFIMEDTGDFRFANLFKLPKGPQVSWIIPNVVKDVDQSQQNRIMGSKTDIRGMDITAGRSWLNTYGLLGFANREPMPFPLTPDKNNINALRKQPGRVGYKSYLDIQTLGDYSNGAIQIIPYYYWLDIQTGEMKKVDIYMDVNGVYEPINIFKDDAKWKLGNVYNNATILAWEDEYKRRNYSALEQARTEAVAAEFQVYDTSGNLIDLPIPLGRFHTYGNSQLLRLNGRNRTFVGTSTVNGADTNPLNVFSDILYGRQAQRWHFTSGLPSSAVAVDHAHGVYDADGNYKNIVTQAKIDALKTNNSVLLMALDIKAIGQTYVLQYNDPIINKKVTIAGMDCDLSAIPYPVVEVMSTTKSARDDLETSGTH